MSVRLITPPTAEPVTVADARLACRIDFTGDDLLDAAIDAELMRDISAMREVCEHMTLRSIMPQTWEITLDAFPAEIELFFPSVIAIDSIKYINESLVETTLPINTYMLSNEREYEAWVLPVSAFPSTAAVANAVKVRYQAGYANADVVPSAVKKWILSAVKYSRDGGCDGVGELPRDFNAGLLDRIKTFR